MNDVSSSPIQTLPEEVFLKILRTLALGVSSETDDMVPKPGRIAALATVCRAWTGPVHFTVERYARFVGAHQAKAYLARIKQWPEIALRLRTLVRTGWQVSIGTMFTLL